MKPSRYLISALLLTLTVAIPMPVLAKTSSYNPPLGAPSPTAVMEKPDVTAPATAPADTVEKKPAYPLPYPGILPDNPLYGLKRLRDKILEALIVDPVRKAEFYLLQADKHLSMVGLLTQKGKTDLANEFLGKAETFMQMSVAGMIAHKTAGREVPGYLVDRYQRALDKHKEVLVKLMETAPDAQKDSITKALGVLTAITQDVVKLK